MRWRGPKVSILTMLMISLAIFGQNASAQSADERAVKATFLVKLLDYVTWPSQSGRTPSRIVICVVGDDIYGSALDSAVEGQQIDHRTLVVLRHPRASQLASCQVAIIRGSPSFPTSEILRQLNNRPILTVTDERFGRSRGIIHFDTTEGRVGFHIDEAQAAQNHLSISSQVLGLALSVRRR